MGLIFNISIFLLENFMYLIFVFFVVFLKFKYIFIYIIKCLNWVYMVFICFLEILKLSLVNLVFLFFCRCGNYIRVLQELGVGMVLINFQDGKLKGGGELVCCINEVFRRL